MRATAVKLCGYGVLATVLFLFTNSCLFGQTVIKQQSCTTEYSTSFQEEKTSWYKLAPEGAVRLSVAPKGVATSAPPWIVDHNHSGSDGETYGRGLIQVIALAWLKAYPYKPQEEPGIIGQCVNLSDVAVLYDVARSDLKTNGATLRFWFQTVVNLKDGRYFAVNYAYRKILPTDASRPGHPHRLVLTSKAEDWICLGAKDKTDRFPDHSDFGWYGCAESATEFETLISKVSMDFGFIFILEPYSFKDHSPMLANLDLPSGSIAFSGIRVTKHYSK